MQTIFFNVLFNVNNFSWKYVLVLLVISFLVYLFMFPINEAFQSFASSLSSSHIESFENNSSSKCPNVLIQNGSRFFLYNTKRIDVPGVNPIEFDTLEDYVEFIKYQKKMGFNCPILYLQQSMGAQGNMEFRLRPDVLEPQAGLNPMLPSQMTNITPYERKMANDSLAQMLAQNIATSTNIPLTQKEINNLDLTKSTLSETSRCTGEDGTPPLVQGKSPDPMQYNWGGIAFSEKLVDSGYYAGNEIYKVTPGVYSLNTYDPTLLQDETKTLEQNNTHTPDYLKNPLPPNTNPHTQKSYRK